MTRILCINPGSTSTKIAIFDGEKKVLLVNLAHSNDELKKYDSVFDQFAFRKESIIAGLKENNIPLDSIDAIACRGGLIRPLPSGTYLVDDQACEEFKKSKINHPCNIAILIGRELANELGVKAYFTDSPCTYEMAEIATISGFSKIIRKGNFHALNHKAIARFHAKNVGKAYEDLNLIVAHLGGGISIAAHQKGVAIDTTDGDEEGPFSPQRSGIVPTRPLIDLCFSGEYTHDEIKSFMTGKGGLVSYLGINDVKEAVDLAQTDEKAKLVVDAIAYQISKDICSMGAVLKGDVDGILLTGGIAYSDYLMAQVKERCSHVAPVYIYPGEREMEALAEGVLRVVAGEPCLRVGDIK